MTQSNACLGYLGEFDHPPTLARALTYPRCPASCCGMTPVYINKSCSRKNGGLHTPVLEREHYRDQRHRFALKATDRKPGLL